MKRNPTDTKSAPDAGTVRRTRVRLPDLPAWRNVGVRNALSRAKRRAKHAAAGPLPNCNRTAANDGGSSNDANC